MSWLCFPHHHFEDDCISTCSLDLSDIQATFIPSATAPASMASLQLCGFPSDFCDCPSKDGFKHNEVDSCKNFFALNGCAVSGNGLITGPNLPTAGVNITITSTLITGSCVTVPIVYSSSALIPANLGGASVMLNLSVTCNCHHTFGPVMASVTVPLAVNSSADLPLLSLQGSTFTALTTTASSIISFSTTTSTNGYNNLNAMTTGTYNNGVFTPVNSGYFDVEFDVSFLAGVTGGNPTINVDFGLTTTGTTLSGTSLIPASVTVDATNAPTATPAEFTLSGSRTLFLVGGSGYGLFISVSALGGATAVTVNQGAAGSIQSAKSAFSITQIAA